MRSLWLVPVAIGAAVLILTHVSIMGVVIGVVFLGLGGYLLLRPMDRKYVYRRY